MPKNKNTESFRQRIAQASPGAVVLFIAGLILVGALSARLVAGGAFSRQRAYPQFVFEQKAARSGKKQHDASDVPADKPLFDGEVYHKANRLQELLDVSVAAVLYVTNNQSDSAGPQEFVNGLPKDAGALLLGLREKNLLPPGVNLTNDFKLASESSTLILRYRTDPFDVEVISLPRTEEAGPLLLLRLSDDGTTEGVRYFESLQLTGVEVPEPFSPTSKIVSLGWMPKQVKGQMIASEDLARARASLSQAGLAK